LPDGATSHVTASYDRGFNKFLFIFLFAARTMFEDIT
jgi:hypothetical protein